MTEGPSKGKMGGGEKRERQRSSRLNNFHYKIATS